jgi:hypothetical protein
MKAPRQPGVEPKKDANVYCLHRPPLMTPDIRPLLAISIKSTKSIITKTKKLIIKACLMIDKDSMLLFAPQLRRKPLLLFL